jgi:hypothetical protein
MPTRREPSRDIGAVALILVKHALCVECIMSDTGLDLDRVLDAISALEAQLQLIRSWGRCLFCLKKDRAILAVDVSSGSRRAPATMPDGPGRHNDLRCMKCEKQIRLTLGECALLRRGQPYHKACAPPTDATR